MFWFRRGERGSEFVAFIFTLPVMFFLMLGILESGLYFAHRSAVTEVVRDSARGMAAYGADCPVPDVIPGKPECFSDQAEARLWQDGRCTFGRCSEKPVVTCMDQSGDTRVRYARSVVTCSLNYPYIPTTGSLFSSGGLRDLGLGLGSLFSAFDIEVSAVSEVGFDGTIGVQ